MNKPSIRARKVTATLGITLLFVAAFLVSGFTIAGIDSQASGTLPPARPPLDGGGQTQTGPVSGQQGEPELVNVIRNGDFELPWPDGGIAPEWEGYRNGQAWAEFYKETWNEAVYNGEQAQLMEIFQVEPNILDRFIAIHQTVAVAPNSRYDLTIHALMRSQVQAADRNKFEFEMNWGVDYTGSGRFEDVQTWNYMPLEEQFRLGSTGEYPEDIPLRYETITGTIYTTGTNQITLFIRGWKKFPTGAEVNFDVDGVSLIGPDPGTVVVITPVPTTAPALPISGVSSARQVPTSVVIIGGLVLAMLGAGAAAGLLKPRKE